MHDIFEGIEQRIDSRPRVQGFRRPLGRSGLFAMEDRQIDPIAVALKNKLHLNNQQRTFCYSKVVNSMMLANDLESECQPWINCITDGSVVVGYIWDSRIIVFVEKNGNAVNKIMNADWKDTVYDVYNACTKQRPVLLQNPNNIEGGNDFVKLASKWTQPTAAVNYYQTRRVKGVWRHEEYEVCTFTRRDGEVYLGEVVIEEPKNNVFRAGIRMPHDLLKDVWPNISKKCEQFTIQKLDRIPTYEDVQMALLNGLVAR